MHQDKQNKKAILSTVAYADIFNFPLTKSEIKCYLISKIPNKFEIDRLITLLTKEGLLSRKDKLFALKGREKNFQLRNERERFSEKKLIIARKMVKVLSKIPTVRLIGISGSLALNNAKEDDDIDLFIVTRKNTMWITRLIVLFILELIGSRRKRLSKNTKNTFCVNM